MNTLLKRSHQRRHLLREVNDTFFGRSIHDVFSSDFFNTPSANIREEADGYTLEIAVPGMTRKDIDIQLDGSVLKVSAQNVKKNTSWTTMEYNSSSLYRSFTLPVEVNADSIQASCEDGLLIIKMKKKNSERGRRVIQVSDREVAINGAKSNTSWWRRLKERLMSTSRKF
jgi:HSP20 family protein